MAVLNTTSPTAMPAAPIERPRNTVPSARTSAAASEVVIYSRERIRKAAERGLLVICRFIEAGIIRAALFQAKHVRHVIEACTLSVQPLRGAQRAAGIG